MLKGLSKPKSSPEYKLARVELNRLAAPILAVVLPTIAVIVLIVVTQVTSQSQGTIEVEIAETKEEEQLEEEQPEEEPEPPPEPPDEYVDVQVDTPSVTVSEMNAPTPTSEPLSVKPAPQDSVAIIKSPVTMRSMTGSRSPGSIGAMTRGGAGYGDAATEAAVYKVLRWLKYKQRPETTADSGAIGNLPTTALAVLVYLAHGETPSSSKEFGDTVRRAIQRLVDWQIDRNGVATFVGTDGACGNHHAFQHGIGVAFHHRAVHKRARVALIGVTNHIFFLAGLNAGKFPFFTGGKPRTAAPAQARLRHLFADFFGRHLRIDAFGLGVTAVGNIFVDIFGVDAAAIMQ